MPKLPVKPITVNPLIPEQKVAYEIERKFLLKDDSWRGQAKGTHYCQGYLCSSPQQVVRIRTAGRRAYLTIKSEISPTTRLEYEYRIPLRDAREMLQQLCSGPHIDKTRYRLPVGHFIWEIDEFHGENTGLVIAEVELESADQEFEKPSWAGIEVTADRRYYNACLATFPYSRWEK